MEKMPLYLLWYFLRIRKHSGEKGYFVSRFKSMERDKMLIEVQMIDQLYKLNLVMLPEKRLEKIFDPNKYALSPGVIVDGVGTEYQVPYCEMLFITPSGKYILRELLFNGFGKIGWTVFVAIVSAATALFVAA